MTLLAVAGKFDLSVGRRGGKNGRRRPVTTTAGERLWGNQVRALEEKNESIQGAFRRLQILSSSS